jgi:hypothetical protein
MRRRIRSLNVLRASRHGYDPGDEYEALRRLVAQVKQTTQEATAALEAALHSCAQSAARIDAMETAHAARE